MSGPAKHFAVNIDHFIVRSATGPDGMSHSADPHRRGFWETAGTQQYEGAAF